MTTFTAEVTLREAVTFDATAGSGHSLVIDSPEVSGGGNAGFRPLELLLVGIGGCAGQVGVSLLRRMRQDVTAFRVRVEANRAEEHPKVYTDVTVEYEIEGRDLSLPAVLQAMTLATSKYCPVVIMMGKATKLSHRYHVRDLATGEEHEGALE